MSTVIKKCTCPHEFQDKKYGTGLRVMNRANKTNTAKCTVCGLSHDVAKSVDTPKT